MVSQARTFIAYANFLVAACIGAWCLYLISMPLHPLSSDSHAGFLAVFSGMALVPVSLSTFLAGWLIKRESKYALLMQLIALILVVALVVILIM
jgi:hypothetical protein